MNELIKKYDINIFYEKIFTWKHKEINIEDLDDIIYENNSIIFNFNLIGKVNSKDLNFSSKKGYFTEKDIIEIIFTYYNGNLSPNELTDIKKIYEIEQKIETRKDLLYIGDNFHFNGFIKKNNKYCILLE